MDKFGLIGKTLKHSFSKDIHSQLGNYNYELYELKEEELESFVKSDIVGFNVTVPYKQKIFEYLDEVSPWAKSIGAVNTVIKRKGKTYGFNTDFDGMVYMIERAGITLTGKVVMIFGSGGTSHTARAVAQHMGAKEVIIVSRSGKVNYDNYKDYSNAEILINTTPIGMYPDNYESVIDNFDTFRNLSGVIDVIYNPLMTAFTYMAKKRNVPYTNGLPMLVAQAKYAMEIFMDKKVDNSIIEEIIANMEKDRQNIVLVGMPSCGKSTVGRILADKLNGEFIDTDSEIVKRENKEIPDIFKDSGESYFRSVEREVLKDVGRLTGRIIATGGGVVKNMENYFPLKQNSTIIYIKRDTCKLLTSGRPLSKDKEAIEKLYDERKELYSQFADYVVDNNGDIEETVKGVMKLL